VKINLKGAETYYASDSSSTYSSMRSWLDYRSGITKIGKERDGEDKISDCDHFD
jgi:hypothetical protein